MFECWNRCSREQIHSIFTHQHAHSHTHSLTHSLTATGEIVLEGMGELHLEITRERLQTEFGLQQLRMSRARVAYKECVSECESEGVSECFERVLSEGVRLFASLTGTMKPLSDVVVVDVVIISV